MQLSDLHDCSLGLCEAACLLPIAGINNHFDEAGSFCRFIVPEPGAGHIHISELAAAQRTLLFCSCSLNTTPQSAGIHPGVKHQQPEIDLHAYLCFRYLAATDIKRKLL